MFKVNNKNTRRRSEVFFPKFLRYSKLCGKINYMTKIPYIQNEEIKVFKSLFPL